MTPTQLPSREEMRSTYHQGEDATLTVFGMLVSTIRALEARVQALEDQLKKDSHNSGKPPSSDGMKKPVKARKRHKSSKKAGGQVGHPGHRLDPVEKVDHVEVHVVKNCQHCAVSLEHIEAERTTKRQVFDLPTEIKVEVTEHQAEVKTCPVCGTKNTAEFPFGVTQATQYGPWLGAQIVYFNQYHFIPMERTVEIVQDLYGQTISAGTVPAISARVAAQVKQIHEEVRAYLTKTEEAVHFEETGMKVSGKLHWLHSASTKWAMLCHIHSKRGSEAMSAMDILPKRTGWSIHDFWKPYLRYQQAKHGLCNAHLVRELIFIAEQYQQAWATELLDLLLKIKQTIEKAQHQNLSTLSEKQQIAFQMEYDRLVAQGEQANPPPKRVKGKRGRVKQSPARNLLDRLRDHTEKVLAFMYDFKVPFDNNLAERDIRMAKVHQKVSGGFRSENGASSFCYVRSYITTARKNDQRILDALYMALSGSPYQPPFLATIVAE